MKDEKREPNHFVTICNQIYLPPQNLSPPSSSNLLKHPLHLSKASIRVFFFFLNIRAKRPYRREFTHGTTNHWRHRRELHLLHLRITFKTGELTSGIFRLQERDEHLGGGTPRVSEEVLTWLEMFGNCWLIERWVGWKWEGSLRHYCIEMGPIFLRDQSWCKMYEVNFFCRISQKIIVHCVWGWCHIMTPELGGYGCDNRDLSWSWAPKDQDHAWCYELDPHDSSGGVDDWKMGVEMQESNDVFFEEPRWNNWFGIAEMILLMEEIRLSSWD